MNSGLAIFIWQIPEPILAIAKYKGQAKYTFSFFFTVMQNTIHVFTFIYMKYCEIAFVFRRPFLKVKVKASMPRVVFWFLKIVLFLDWGYLSNNLL